MGNEAHATGNGSIAVGGGSVASEDMTLSVGHVGGERRIVNVAPGVNGTDAVNVDQLNGALAGSGNPNFKATTALPSAVAGGTESVAAGGGSSASAPNSVAVGSSSAASAQNSVAVGVGSSATAVNSVALGAGSVASAPNTVSMGAPGSERRVTNIADGIAPSDAVTVGQMDRAANWALGQSKKYAAQGIAAVAALSQAQIPSAGKTALSVGLGHYDGESAVGVSLNRAVGEGSSFGFGAASTSGGKPVVRAGFTVSW